MLEDVRAQEGAVVNIIGLAGESYSYDYVTGTMGNASLMAFTALSAQERRSRRGGDQSAGDPHRPYAHLAARRGPAAVRDIGAGPT
jgi:hypothetical protein